MQSYRNKCSFSQQIFSDMLERKKKKQPLKVIGVELKATS